MYKKILLILFICLCSCERKPLYLQGDCMLTVNVTTQVSIDTYWPHTWRDSLVYDWAKTGKEMGYSKPDSVQFLAFHGNTYTENRIKTNKRQLIDITLNRKYNFLIFNLTENINSSYSGGRYYIETPNADNNSGIFENNYETVLQPGEVFSSYIEDIYLSDNVDDYDEIYENGKIVYVYNIDAELTPVSYIYIVQFIIVNDDSTMIEAKDITDFTISGICSKKNLFNNQPIYNGKKQIAMSNVEDGQYFGDSLLVFASRITILDVISNDPTSSWVNYENYLYYTGIDVLTQHYGSISGIVDITRQLNENPKGGIITVRIMNSDLKKGGGSKTGFGIDVSEWEKHIIDIPF